MLANRHYDQRLSSSIHDLKPSIMNEDRLESVDRLSIPAGTGEMLLRTLSVVHTHVK